MRLHYAQVFANDAAPRQVVRADFRDETGGTRTLWIVGKFTAPVGDLALRAANAGAAAWVIGYQGQLSDPIIQGGLFHGATWEEVLGFVYRYDGTVLVPEGESSLFPSPERQALQQKLDERNAELTAVCEARERDADELRVLRRIQRAAWDLLGVSPAHNLAERVADLQAACRAAVGPDVEKAAPVDGVEEAEQALRAGIAAVMRGGAWPLPEPGAVKYFQEDFEGRVVGIAPELRQLLRTSGDDFVRAIRKAWRERESGTAAEAPAAPAPVDGVEEAGRVMREGFAAAMRATVDPNFNPYGTTVRVEGLPAARAAAEQASSALRDPETMRRAVERAAQDLLREAPINPAMREQVERMTAQALRDPAMRAAFVETIRSVEALSGPEPPWRQREADEYE